MKSLRLWIKNLQINGEHEYCFGELSKSVESIQTGSGPIAPPPQHIPPPQNVPPPHNVPPRRVPPQYVPPDEEETENAFDDSDGLVDVEERFQPGHDRRPNRRFDRRNDRRER